MNNKYNCSTELLSDDIPEQKVERTLASESTADPVTQQIIIITGRIARMANCWYWVYSEVNLSVYRASGGHDNSFFDPGEILHRSAFRRKLPLDQCMLVEELLNCKIRNFLRLRIATAIINFFHILMRV